MASTELIAAAKMAKRMTTDVFDLQVSRLLDAALFDLGCAGVEGVEDDPLVDQARITYFLLNFGEPDEYDRLKKSYDEQKAQLSMRTGYTDWGDS
jgi:hypothetical protein